MPATCVSCISPRFHYRRLAFCFLPLAAILEFAYFLLKKRSNKVDGIARERKANEDYPLPLGMLLKQCGGAELQTALGQPFPASSTGVCDCDCELCLLGIYAATWETLVEWAVGVITFFSVGF
jgi:hypothetical protein